MRQLTFTILALLFCIQRPILAQDATPAPWPPDPSKIFEAGIEAIEQRQPTTTPVVTTPQLISNNDKRLFMIEYPNVNKTEQYAYPKQFKSIGSHSDLNDEQIWLEVNEISDKIWVWSLDRLTKTFTRYSSLCQQQSPLFIDDIQPNTWVLYKGQQDNQTYLCETATGKLSQPLPDNMVWGLADGNYPEKSPDGQWLVLFSTAKDYQNTGDIFVYSYSTSNDRLNQLGHFNPDENLSIDRWVGTQVLIYTGDFPEWSMRTIYIADVRKAQSLEYAIGRYRYQPDYQDNPPRFDYIAGIEGSDGPHGCSWVVYSIETRQTVIHDLGTMCAPEIGNLNEDAYYRDVPESADGSRKTAYLVRYNATTGKRQELYSGEIESVEWVSPDEHYAIMTLGTNGVISRVPYLQSDAYDLKVQELRLSYVDLVSKKVLFDIPAYWDFDGDWWLDSFIKKVDQNTFLAVGYTDYQEGFASLFTFDGTKYVEKRLVNHVVKALGEYLLVWTDGLQKSTRLSLYEIATGRSIPIIQNVDPHQYRIQLDEVEERISLDNFIITITNVPTTTADYHSVRYEVKIRLN